MANRKMKPAQALQLVRTVARKRGMKLVDVPKRGKGSHRQYVLTDSTGQPVAKIGLTDHPRELSWTVLRNIEQTLNPWFGENWMEKQR
ncbi:MAG: hypothetical protein L0H84_24185 [Pseudonocardia sp.]|nr:hypothetical protein [Pseudonocardia sp.]